MSEETKKELQEAEDNLEKLRIWHNANSSDQSDQCLDHEELAKASEKVRLSRVKHLTLEYTDKGWPYSRIEIELRKLKLLS